MPRSLGSVPRKYVFKQIGDGTQKKKKNIMEKKNSLFMEQLGKLVTGQTTDVLNSLGNLVDLQSGRSAMLLRSAALNRSRYIRNDMYCIHFCIWYFLLLVLNIDYMRRRKGDWGPKIITTV